MNYISNVTTYDDSRGVAGDWSYTTANGGTMWRKVSVSPHQWVSWSVGTNA